MKLNHFPQGGEDTFSDMQRDSSIYFSVPNTPNKRVGSTRAQRFESFQSFFTGDLSLLGTLERLHVSIRILFGLILPWI